MESMHAGVGARADLIVVGVDTHKGSLRNNMLILCRSSGRGC